MGDIAKTSFHEKLAYFIEHEVTFDYFYATFTRHIAVGMSYKDALRYTLKSVGNLIREEFIND